MTSHLRTYCEQCTTVTDVVRDEQARQRCATCSIELKGDGANEVFVSYSSVDEALARTLELKLRHFRLRAWFAPARLEIGDDFIDEIANAIPRVRAGVFLLSQEAMASPWVRREAADLTAHDKDMYVVLLNVTKISRKWGFLLSDRQYKITDDANVERVFDRIVKQIVRASDPGESIIPRKATGASSLSLEAMCGVKPNVRIYPGPRPFTSSMEEAFCGRDEEYVTLVSGIQRRSQLLIAPSGAGKSSLLEAAIVPRLQSSEGGKHQVLSGMRVGRTLPSSYEKRRSEIKNIFTFSASYMLDRREPDNAMLQESLAEAMAHLRQPEPGRLRVVVLDQFEEIFTQHADRFKDRFDFVRQVEHALDADPCLRFVFAIRQEYLADALSLFELMQPDVRPEAFRLGRLKEGALHEAIRMPAAPYTRYSNEVVNEIIRQLKLTRVRLPDGTVSDVEAEHVELVHLQIVCASLWEKLPAGITEVNLDHLRQASMSLGNGEFGSFVRNAIENFYNRVVTDVADSEETRQLGGYEPKLIKLGCMRFISRDGMRLTIQEGRRRTGRLPNAVVKQLADRYLLRITTVGTERWYELSHDLVAAAVARELDPKVSELMFAADRLEKELKRRRERAAVEVADATGRTAETPDGDVEPGRMFPQWFEPKGDLLEACDPFRRQEGLDEEEAEFILRHALGSGRHAREWASRVMVDHPSVYERVILDALASTDVSVRVHAVRSIVHDHLTRDASERLLEKLNEVSGRDSDRLVRREIAKHFIALNDNRLHARVTERAAQNRMGLVFAAEMLAVSDVDDKSTFDSVHAMMSGSLRRRVRVRAWAIRFGLARKRLLYALLPTAAASMLFAGGYKAIPGALGWALVQDSRGAGMGLFHGMTAGAIWGGLIPTAVALHQWVFFREKSRKSLLQPFAAIVSGAMGGFFASCLVVAVILSVYSPTSLRTMGWVAQPQEARFSIDFFREAFVTTRMGWAHLWLGSCMGIGAALSLNLLRVHWPRFLADCKAPESLRDVRRLMGSLVRMIAPRFWPVPLVLILGAVLIQPVLRPGITDLHEKPSPEQVVRGETPVSEFGPDGLRIWQGVAPEKLNVVNGLVGDVSTQIVGLVGTLLGLGLGMVVLRRGLIIPAETEQT